MRAKCRWCDNDIEPVIKEVEETYPVKGDTITVRTQVAFCPDCDKEVYCESLDSVTVEKAYALFRAKHGLLSPEVIRETREKYGLSQRSFSLLLGWGEVTLHRYESGSLQDPAHDATLRLATRPENVKLLFEANGNRLPPQQRAILEQRLESLLDGSCVCEAVGLYVPRVTTVVDQFTGFRGFSSEKLREMIVFFCKSQRTYKTKLNKLMFYADFLHFRKFTVSISGSPYLHLQHGPVPEHYDIVQASLVEDGSLVEHEVDFREYGGSYFTIGREPDLSLFSDEELASLEFVCSHFASWTSKGLRDYSHEEDAYKSTQYRETISYLSSDTLSITLPE
ncbi:MAG TPA: type II TA system antitoxin MqsA family protein [Coriobacteriia bacterium]|jgi:putative zinc finger/helix-turn-helix YgiT family protein